VALIIAATAVPVGLRGPAWWGGGINFLDVAQNLMLYIPLGAALSRRPSFVAAMATVPRARSAWISAYQSVFDPLCQIVSPYRSHPRAWVPPKGGV